MFEAAKRLDHDLAGVTPIALGIDPQFRRCDWHGGGLECASGHRAQNLADTWSARTPTTVLATVRHVQSPSHQPSLQ